MCLSGFINDLINRTDYIKHVRVWQVLTHNSSNIAAWSVASTFDTQSSPLVLVVDK